MAGWTAEVNEKLCFYILNPDHTIYTTTDVREWGAWFEDVSKRRVDQTIKDGVRISTVFLGIDHGFGFGVAPLLFETMIFGGEHDMDQWRYASWEAAVEGHEYAVRIATGEEEHEWHTPTPTPLA